MSDAGATKPWAELRDTKPRKLQKTRPPRGERTPHHWRTMILSWLAIIVVLATATYAVNAWVNRSLVVVPPTLGGMPLSVDPAMQSMVDAARREQHPEPGAPSTQYTVTAYGTESDYAVSVIIPVGHAVSDRDIDQIPEYQIELEFDPPTVLDSARCIVGTGAGGTTVWCIRTDDTTSVLTRAGPDATVGRTAAMTGEAFDAQH